MGRQLATFGDISYTYNEEGIRTSKTVNGVKTSFLLDGYNIIEQTDGTTTLHFFYDSNGELIGFRYNGNDYFYVKNVMGDIIAITDSNKNIVAEYRYDPWGKVLNEEYLTSIGELNPFRYRSYYYDSDIKMYYLQSRYYDAEVGRFINCDDVNYIGVTELEISYNPFAYCENNPVNDSDFNGTLSAKKIKECVKKAIKFFTDYISRWIGLIKEDFVELVKIKKREITVKWELAAFAIDTIIEISGIYFGKFMSATTKLMNFFSDRLANEVLKIFKKQIVPILINGSINKILTSIRKGIWNAAYIASKYAIGSAVNSFFKAGLGEDDIKNNKKLFSNYTFRKILKMLSSPGNFICAFLDVFDGKDDEKITIRW